MAVKIFSLGLPFLLSQQSELKTKIRTTSPKYAAIKYPEPLNLDQIQQQLDDDTLVLEYSLAEEQSYLWAVASNSIDTYQLPARVVDNRSDTAQTGAIRNATTPVIALRELRREGQELNRIR